MDKVRQKFLLQFLVGVICSEKLILTEVSRKLNKEKEMDLNHWVKRFSRELSSKNWNEDPLVELTLEEGLEGIKPTDVIAADLSDVAKPYGEKFEYLSKVWDGSEGEIEKGYGIFGSCVVKDKGDYRLVMLDPFSKEQPGFKGENIHILNQAARMYTLTQGKGIFVYDRGADRRNLLIPIIDKKYPFVIRLCGNRHVFRGKCKTVELVDQIVLKAKPKGKWNRWDPKEKRWKKYEIGYCQIYLPERTGSPLWLVWGRWEDQEPIMLLTSCRIGNIKQARLCLRRYFQRWAAEEIFRFVKDSLGLETFRVRSFRAIKRLFLIATLATQFIEEIQNMGKEVVEFLEEKAQTIPKDCNLYFYRIAAGLAVLFQEQCELLFSAYIRKKLS